jgi:glycosyltransferase involved in cell wall biosynthesis
VKSHRPNEKGVIILEYNYILPAFARLFDLDKVARRYHLVLEPSWSGYCTPEVLTYSQYAFPVFVQAYEPRDAAFIQNLRANLIPVPTSTNWWVDHRLFRPLPDVAKEFDLIMIAAWGAYKRHHCFFHALRDLRVRGHRLRALLLGYPIGMSLKEILDQARFYGVEDQLEVHELVPYKQVNDFLNRAKINIMWSRKEGVNRAIIEGMFAGVPCLVREGFNYGYKYSYINEQTGCFSTERQLPDTILTMLENHARFNPRDWVMENMSCQRATAILSAKIKEVATKAGEPWTEDLTPKVNWLQGMGYWNPEDEGRFAEDIAYLTTTYRQ